MSFSSDIKDKLCMVEMSCPMCTVAETAGILNVAGHMSEAKFKFKTENNAVVKRTAMDIENAFGIRAKISETARSKSIIIDDRFEVENISGGVSGDVTPFECCKASYLRGAFLGGGSVSDPNKSYHLEINTKSLDEAKKLLELIGGYGFMPKMTERKGSLVVYLKGCDGIADFLGLIGAPVGALELFTVQVEKEMRNNINRQVNCENANAEKMAKAASKHIFAIERIKKAGRWDKLPDVLQEIGELRCMYPEYSLKELGESLDNPIGKSGVNHRLNRIIEYARQL